MITRDDIRELAEFESPEGCALSFFYQPSVPRNQAHREEAILVKDLVRNAMRDAEKHGKNGCAREGLERILGMADSLRGNNRRGKAVFLCGKHNFYREFDLPPRLRGTFVTINNRFHLRPLTGLADVLPRIGVALVDRSKARFFELWMDEIHEREGFTSELPRRGKSDGFAGFDAGHAERHVANEAMHHFQRVGEFLEKLQQNGYERFVIGCRDETWSSIEPQLHSYVKDRLVGRFNVDPATATAEQVRDEAERLLQEFRANRRQGLVREALGEASRNGRGAIGVRKVLQSLQTGEVQTLLLAQSFAAPGVQCGNCGFFDNGILAECSMCGQKTREVEDLADPILRYAVRNRITIAHIDNEDLATAEGIAALLRFRADQNTEMKKAV
jgi:peptide chain release factor subunit 1